MLRTVGGAWETAQRTHTEGTDMSTSSTNLFQGEYVHEYLEGRLSMAEREIAKAALEEICDEQFEAKMVDRFRAQPLRLLREEADFTPSDTQKGIEVRLLTPLEGDTRLLHHPPQGWSGGRPYATIEQGRWTSTPSGKPTLTLTERFEAGTPTEQVRQWGREQVDFIESVLSLQQTFIDEYNEQLTTKVSEWTTRRRSILANVSELSGGLGKGV